MRKGKKYICKSLQAVRNTACSTLRKRCNLRHPVVNP